MGQRARAKRKYEIEVILSKRQDPGPFPLILVLDHLKAGFNVAKILRTANAFGLFEVHLVGVPPFDPTPARGALKQTRTKIYSSIESSFQDLRERGYEIFAFDPKANKKLGEKMFSEKTAFVFGHEEYGLSFIDDKVQLLSIPQFGQVESMNVSIVASIASFEYLRQFHFTPPNTGEHYVST